MKKILPLLLAAALGASAEDYYVKQVEFPAGASIEQKVAMAARLVPTEKQMAWQDLELTAFLHFGMNTFTDREWGDGKESPSLFNPDSLDTDQWAKALSEAGFKLALLTAKHHDGFCLWPTATTAHSVASSPWLDGKGDVVGMLSRSCRKYGLKFGVYLSPWDRNAECYGDSPRYNDMFVAQLTELLSNYGEIDEVWFDGACGEGPNGKRQEYDWARFKATIERLQPDAVMAIMGDDVRWVGNEKGLGRDTEWSATVLAPDILPEAAASREALGLSNKAPDLGSRQMLEKANKLYWWPSEVDVSIRPGWFFHEAEAPHSLQRLADIYLNSVGKNSVLLLNIPPDNHGRISSADVERMMELRHWIDANFDSNLAQGEGLAQALSGTVNAIVVAEDIARGQRVEAFAIDAYADGQWRQVAEGTTIGKKRILSFDDVEADSVRVRIEQSRGEAHVSIAGAYLIEMPAEEAYMPLPEGYAFAQTGFWKVADQAITLRLAAPAPVAGFEYVPILDDSDDGIVGRYRVSLSLDGENWLAMCHDCEFGNIANNPIPQLVYFGQPVEAAWLRLESIETLDGAPAHLTDSNVKIILAK